MDKHAKYAPRAIFTAHGWQRYYEGQRKLAPRRTLSHQVGSLLLWSLGLALPLVFLAMAAANQPLLSQGLLTLIRLFQAQF
jgi:hypothetical protein